MSYIRPSTAARFTGLSKATIYRAIRAGQLPARKKRGKQGSIIISPDDLNTYIVNFFESNQQTNVQQINTK